MACVLALASVEAAIEGYVPILEMLRGAEISHFEFGISSIHGLILAALSASGTYFIAIYVASGRREYLMLSLIPLLYAFAFVSRKMFSVCIVQYILIFTIIKKYDFKSIMKILAVSLLFVYIFGVFGDIRGRTQIISEYGGMIGDFNFIGGSGVQWVYLYLTTPVDNLSYTINFIPSEWSLLPIRTYGDLVPSAIREIFDPSSGASHFVEVSEERYWLRSAVFNVSTGFNPPYLDGGLTGVFLQSAFVGSVTYYLHRRSNNILNLCLYVTFLSGSLLTVFSNNFGNLNFVGQVLFYCAIFYLAKGRRRSRSLARPGVKFPGQ